LREAQSGRGDCWGKRKKRGVSLSETRFHFRRVNLMRSSTKLKRDVTCLEGEKRRGKCFRKSNERMGKKNPHYSKEFDSHKCLSTKVRGGLKGEIKKRKKSGRKGRPRPNIKKSENKRQNGYHGLNFSYSEPEPFLREKLHSHER